MSGVAVKYSDQVCYKLEKDYSLDTDVRCILEKGTTPLNLLEASKVVKEKENSKLIKLPIGPGVEAEALRKEGESYESIEDLAQITNIACSEGSLKMVLECIEMAKMEDVMLKVQGPFSCLLSVVGSNQLLRWMAKYPNEIKLALEKITSELAEYIIEALDRGVNIISLADPSGMSEILGEKRYGIFVATYILKLLKKIEGHLDRALVHLCPRTSIRLEQYGFITSEIYYYKRSGYGEVLIELAQYSQVKYVGHRCINAEHSTSDKVYILHLNEGDRDDNL